MSITKVTSQEVKFITPISPLTKNHARQMVEEMTDTVFAAKIKNVSEGVKNTLRVVLQDLRGNFTGLALTKEKALEGQNFYPLGTPDIIGEQHYQCLIDVLNRKAEGSTATKASKAFKAKILPWATTLSEFSKTKAFLEIKAAQNSQAQNNNNNNNIDVVMKPAAYLRKYATELASLKENVNAKTLLEKDFSRDSSLQHASLFVLNSLELKLSSLINIADAEEYMQNNEGVSLDQARLEVYLTREGNAGLASIINELADRLENNVATRKDS